MRLRSIIQPVLTVSNAFSAGMVMAIRDVPNASQCRSATGGIQEITVHIVIHFDTRELLVIGQELEDCVCY